MRTPRLWTGLLGLLGGTLAIGTPFPWGSGTITLNASTAFTMVFSAETHLDPLTAAPSPVVIKMRPVTPALGANQATLTLTPQQPVQDGHQVRMPIKANLQSTRAGVYTPVDAAGLNFLGVTPLAFNPAVPMPGPDRPGQRYLRFGTEGDYRHEGEVPPYPTLRSHVLTLVRMDGRQAVFNVDGLGEVVRKGDPRAGFPDLAPLVEDPDLSALRRKYVGVPVWAYGGLKTDCLTSPQTDLGFHAPLRSPLKIRDILRVATPIRLNVNEADGDDVGDGASVTALTPLVVLVASSPDFTTGGSFSSVTSEGEGNDDALLALQDDGTEPCGDTFVLRLADTWALPRVFSLTPPGRDIPTEIPDNLKTLNRQQYAWLFGFPSASYGTVQELMASTTWNYLNIPFSASVTFDKAGRVKAIQVPRLP